MRASPRIPLDNNELKMFQEVAKELLGFNDRQIADALSGGEIVEICHGDDKA